MVARLREGGLSCVRLCSVCGYAARAAVCGSAACGTYRATWLRKTVRESARRWFRESVEAFVDTSAIN